MTLLALVRRATRVGSDTLASHVGRTARRSGGATVRTIAHRATTTALSIALVIATTAASAAVLFVLLAAVPAGPVTLLAGIAAGALVAALPLILTWLVVLVGRHVTS